MPLGCHHNEACMFCVFISLAFGFLFSELAGKWDVTSQMKMLFKSYFDCEII